MPEKAAIFTFVFAAFMLNIAPGPDMLYVIGRSVGQGRKAGIVSSLGVFIGCWVHILAAAVELQPCCAPLPWLLTWFATPEQPT